jgi:hypothetical protein
VPETPQHEDSTASPGLNYVFKVNKHAHGLIHPQASECTPKTWGQQPRHHG